MLKLLNRKLNKKDNATKGFTLIELVIVIAIVAVLAAVGIPAIAGQVKKSNEATAVSNAKLIADTAGKMLIDCEAAGKSATDMQNEVTYQTAMAKAGITKGTCLTFSITGVEEDGVVVTYSVDEVTYKMPNGNTTGTFKRG